MKESFFKTWSSLTFIRPTSVVQMSLLTIIFVTVMIILCGSVDYGMGQLIKLIYS